MEDMNFPPASYNLTHDKRKVMCGSLQEIRVPSRFSSNIRKLVSIKDLSLYGYNYHDCHVLLTVFVHIAITAVYMKMVITQLCYFFNKISQKLVDEDELQISKNLLGRLRNSSRCASLQDFLI
jgi:hypothetical protein